MCLSPPVNFWLPGLSCLFLAALWSPDPCGLVVTCLGAGWPLGSFVSVFLAL